MTDGVAGGAVPEGSSPGDSQPVGEGTDDARLDDARPDEAEAQRVRARRRRAVDQIFGDVLPTASADQREPGHRGGFSLEHYRASRPPHWGEKK